MITDGNVLTAQRVESPNYDERPDNAEVELIVVHCIALPPKVWGEATIDSFFQNTLDVQDDPYFETIANLRVSAHLLINRQGGLRQYVNLNQRAWHAGTSEFEGKANCNDFSIGIELNGDPDIGYTPSQYLALSQTITAIMQAYPTIGKDSIVGHESIAPGRKTDPGIAFDWDRLKNYLEA